jgi:hypothetical protein
MSEIMKRLEKRAADKVVNTAPKDAFKGVHPKQAMARNIKIKQVIEQATVDDVLGWLENDPQGHIGAGLVIGKIAAWKMEGKVLSKDHEAILKLVKILYDQAKINMDDENV